MPAPSSPFTAVSLLPPHTKFSNSSVGNMLGKCFVTTESIIIFTASSTTSLLLFPIFILVLYFGFQQWRQRLSPISHCDFFLYHTIIMRMCSFLGFCLFFYGGFLHHTRMMWVGLYIWTVVTLGQALLYLLTCVDRYLAVVRPIAYLRLKQAGGERIRDASVGCVWLLCVGWAVVVYLSSSEGYAIFDYCFTAFNLFVISFCSVSVLCALKQPRPGQTGGHRQRVDPTKQRAFNIIIAVMVVLLMRFGGNIIANVMYSSGIVAHDELCIILMADIWFELPSSLLLPLLFLHQGKKLHCCQKNTESARD